MVAGSGAWGAPFAWSSVACGALRNSPFTPAGLRPPLRWVGGVLAVCCPAAQVHPRVSIRARADPGHVIQYWITLSSSAHGALDALPNARTRSSGEPATQLGPGIGPEQLAGVGSAIWTETISDFDDLTFLVLPRLAGNAHKAWSEPRAGEWDEHRAVVAAHGRMWDRDGLTYFRSSLIPWV